MLSTLPKPRSRRAPIVRNEESFLVGTASICNAFEYVRAENPTRRIVECGPCLCAKCSKPIDPLHECRFFVVRGGLRSGLRMPAHLHCVPSAEAVAVSLPTAVEIFLRQATAYVEKPRRKNGDRKAGMRRQPVGKFAFT